MSNFHIPDIARAGDDLLARIDELTVGKIGQDDRDGWRCLLLACGKEIGRLRSELKGIAFRIERNEDVRTMKDGCTR